MEAKIWIIHNDLLACRKYETTKFENKDEKTKQIASVPSTAKRRLSTNNLHIDTLIIGTTCLDSHVTMMSDGLRIFQVRSNE